MSSPEIYISDSSRRDITRAKASIVQKYFKYGTSVTSSTFTPPRPITSGGPYFFKAVNYYAIINPNQQTNVKPNPLQLIISISCLALLSIALLLPMLLASPLASAQGAPPNAQPANPTPIEGDNGGFVPCGNTPSDPCNISHLFRGFIVIVNYLVAMAGFVAVFAMVYSGFRMVMSQGDDGGGLKDAKGRLAGAVIGLLIVMAAFVLINTLFTGSLSVGVCEGEKILSDPVEYIQGSGCGTP